MTQQSSGYWRIGEGGFPGCPPGTVVSFVNEGPTARVIRYGVGQIGTLHRATTSQTATADGSTITLVNEGEGWRAVLTRTTAPGWQVTAPMPPPRRPAGPPLRQRLRNPRTWLFILLIIGSLAGEIALMYAPSQGIDAVGLGLIVSEFGVLFALGAGWSAYRYARGMNGSAGWRVIFLPGAIYRTALGGFVTLCGLFILLSGLTHL
jgi:hypothetical protein